MVIFKSNNLYMAKLSTSVKTENLQEKLSRRASQPTKYFV